MQDSYLKLKISTIQDRLFEARRLLYITTISFLFIALSVIFNTDDVKKNLRQSTQELEGLYRIISSAEKTIEGIRRYFQQSGKNLGTERQYIALLIHSTKNILSDDEILRKHLDNHRPTSRADRRIQEKVYGFLGPFQDREMMEIFQDTVNSLYADVAPDHLDQLHLKDLSALALFASVDPFTVSPMLREWTNRLLHRDFSALIYELGRNVDIVDKKNLFLSLHHIHEKGTDLRMSIWDYVARYSHRPVSTDRDSLLDTRIRYRELALQQDVLQEQLERGVIIVIPWIEIKTSTTYILLMLPIASTVAVGFVSMLLVSALHKSQALPGITERREATDLGLVFTQLSKPMRTEANVARTVFGVLLAIPLLGTISLPLVMGESALDVCTSKFIGAITVYAFVAIYTFIIAFRISRTASGNVRLGGLSNYSTEPHHTSILRKHIFSRVESKISAVISMTKRSLVVKIWRLFRNLIKNN